MRHGGVGDLAVALWIGEGARSRGETVPLVCAGGYADVARAFGQAIVENPTDDVLATGTESVSYRAEMATADERTPRVHRWQTTVGWSYPPVRPAFRGGGEAADAWAREMTPDGPVVVLAPRANVGSRSLPLQKWLRVAWDLKARGVDVLAIDGSKEVVREFPRYAFGFDWPHVLALLARAAVVGGNDSGIPHLAATVGVPTVAAMGPTDPHVVFGHSLDVLTPVVAPAVACAGCHFARGRYGVACDRGCEALDALPWALVRDAILENL